MKIEDFEKAQEFLNKIDGLDKLEKEIFEAIHLCGDCFSDSNNERVHFKGKVSALLQKHKDYNMKKIEEL